MSFTHIMPASDIGLPRGYKNSKAAWRQALKAEKQQLLKKREKAYDRGLLTRHKKDPHTKDKFENYFNQRTSSRPSTSQRPVNNQISSTRNINRDFEPDSTSSYDIPVNTDEIISGIQFGMRDMISRLERGDN